ncbi:hypothetical protein B296_00000163 [Ensete ventricosum]|uniref:Uncharacterized protein n=1 Tax=Ensete ventricosum TaxID=4639 RepID=A0A426YBM3_ENSVE|nr:hypothetical protein B296_00000163 [Ensete ventricosum]
MLARGMISALKSHRGDKPNAQRKQKQEKDLHRQKQESFSIEFPAVKEAVETESAAGKFVLHFLFWRSERKRVDRVGASPVFLSSYARWSDVRPVPDPSFRGRSEAK